MVKGHYCYIVTDDKKRTSYVGYTVNPTRRLRQHRGELKGGAKSTKRMQGTCQFACVIGPFYNSKTALQFEWAMKHHKPKRHYLNGRITKLFELLTIVPNWTRTCLPTRKHPLLSIQWGSCITQTELESLILDAKLDEIHYLLPVDHRFIVQMK